MNVYFLHVRPEISLESAESTLSEAGIPILFSEEGIEEKKIAIEAIPNLPELSWLERIEETSFGEVDWQHEWQQHLDLENGKLFVPLDPYGKEGRGFWLVPGPGFGNLTHPSTGLVLSLMPSDFKGASVIDLGCGSGILGLAALELGALHCTGIDIDKEALVHGRENAALNKKNAEIDFCLPDEMQKQAALGDWLLLNMISSEQKEAIKCLSLLPEHIIASGVLEEEKIEYLEWMLSMGYRPLEERGEGSWRAWHLTNCS